LIVRPSTVTTWSSDALAIEPSINASIPPRKCARTRIVGFYEA
jgi:hypothetical protein